MERLVEARRPRPSGRRPRARVMMLRCGCLGASSRRSRPSLTIRSHQGVVFGQLARAPRPGTGTRASRPRERCAHCRRRARSACTSCPCRARFGSSCPFCQIARLASLTYERSASGSSGRLLSVILDDLLDRGSRRDVAGEVAAHAVGDDEERRPRRDRSPRSCRGRDRRPSSNPTTSFICASPRPSCRSSRGRRVAVRSDVVTFCRFR